jgi:hypothetical protein
MFDFKVLLIFSIPCPQNHALLFIGIQPQSPVKPNRPARGATHERLPLV